MLFRVFLKLKLANFCVFKFFEHFFEIDYRNSGLLQWFWVEIGSVSIPVLCSLGLVTFSIISADFLPKVHSFACFAEITAE